MCNCSGACYCPPSAYFPPPPQMLPLEFYHRSGMIVKPSLCEAGEQIIYIPPTNAQAAQQAVPEFLAKLTSGSVVPPSARAFATTFSVGVCGSTVCYVSNSVYGGVTSITVLYNTSAIETQACVCSVEGTAVMGTLMDQQCAAAYPCSSGKLVFTFKTTTLSPQVVIYLRYKFQD